jgi:hypothetical protein
LVPIQTLLVQRNVMIVQLIPTRHQPVQHHVSIVLNIHQHQLVVIQHPIAYAMKVMNELAMHALLNK